MLKHKVNIRSKGTHFLLSIREGRSQNIDRIKQVRATHKLLSQKAKLEQKKDSKQIRTTHMLSNTEKGQVET
jgi:hypothetical protein